MKIISKSGLATLFLLIGISINIFGQFPTKPEPASPVNDFADVLTAQQEKMLFNQLSQFSYQSSTQIVLVTVPDLQGLDKAQYAVELAHKWGIGQKGKDNGILILVKPKTTSSKGEAYIAVGYGLEGVVPDAVAKQIVEYEMIPEFKIGDYYSGFAKASKILINITTGEYTADQYAQSKGGDIAGLIPFFFFIIIFILFTMKGRNRPTGYGSRSNSSSLLTMMFLGSMMGGGRSSSGWSNFNSGGGSFGGGGFGGFGGGGFGGGGAGGSW
ncbi:MAG: TPM domain-containing protein [Bacteroidales bacterium]|nr:TPM domain-containing protein [Bacteroidales bacterium]RLD36845.1 MAG: TPM domain-containing protein [Bacteroidota bacterium]